MSSLIVLIVVLAIIIVPVVSLPLQRRARSPPMTPARDMLADAISRQGPEWKNVAASVRAGYANVWISRRTGGDRRGGKDGAI